LAPINPPDPHPAVVEEHLARDYHEATRAQHEPGGERLVGFVAHSFVVVAVCM
jgi:hypothetical protein